MGIVLLEPGIVSISDFTGNLTDLANLVATIDPNLVSNYYNKVYTFNCSLIFENNVSISDSKKSLLVLGKYFLFRNNTNIELGASSYKNGKYSGYNGCEVSMPNLELFGSLANDAGKFKASNSIIDIFCRWNILGPNASLTLIGTDISCFGIYNADHSILSQVRYIRSSASNGVLRPTNNLGVYNDVTVDGAVVLDETAPGANSIVIDAFTGNLNLTYGSIDNYSTLINIIDNGIYTGDINLLGTEVLNGYGVSQMADNRYNLFHKFKFSGILYDGYGAILPNYKMTVTDKHGALELSIMTDEFGMFDEWLTYYRDLHGSDRVGEYMTPHTITIENGVSVKINATRNMINVPLFMSNNTTVLQNYSEFKVLIEELLNFVVTADSDNKNYLSTISMALSDKINNVTTTVRNKGSVTIQI